MDNLKSILSLVDSGNSDLLTDEEAALLPAKKKPSAGFGANLAESLSESILTEIAQTVFDGYRADESSRTDWIAREKRGLRLLGVSEKADGAPAFEGASTAVFPGLFEAIVQFQARAIAEVWPPEGPAKAITEGGALNPAREQQAQRVAAYLNWLYCERMPGGYQHHDRMLFRLGLSGSCFKKIAFDALAGCVVSRFVPVEELVVPYGASDLMTAPRITHILKYSGADVERLIESGAYRSIDLIDVSPIAPTELQPELDLITGSRPSSSTTKTDLRSGVKARLTDRASPMICLEQSVFLDIDGEPARAPYLVTIERESQEVLAVYRDWREADTTRQRRRRFVHYYLLPGLDGFYGLGFLHMLGRFAETQSGNLRALLDAAHLANLKGGFRSADIRLPKGNAQDGLRVTPGEWKPIEATADELQKLFVPIPYGEPSNTLFNLLQWMDTVMRRISGTTSELVGETTKNVPVGTTLARIEQGMKVQTAIQIRIHQAQAEELAVVVSATADYLPDAGYCRGVLGVAPETFATEFDARVDVRPVSNPNAITGTQRMAIAQALVDLADRVPDLIDRRVAYQQLLEAMRIQDIDKIMPNHAQTQRMGPVEENMALMMMRPVKSYPDQDHAAHRVVHEQWLGTLEPDYLKRVEATALAHIAEHMAWDYHIRMKTAIGMELPASPMDQSDKQQSNDDPQIENTLALMAAQAAQLMQQQQMQAQRQNSVPQSSQSEVDQAKAEAEIRRKDAIAAAQISRDDHAIIAKLSRDAAEQEARLIGKYMSTEGIRALESPDPEPEIML